MRHLLRWLALPVVAVVVGCVPPPPPRLPPVKPANVVFKPVCRYSNGLMGWTGKLADSGAYRVKLFNGPAGYLYDYTNPKKPSFTVGMDPNQVFVLVKRLWWVLEYQLTNGVWVEVSIRHSAPPPAPCTI